MAVFTRVNYNCACSREVCDLACTTYATMMSDLVPNTASQPFKSLSKPFKSNADRIRSMTDEELAAYLSHLELSWRPVYSRWDRNEWLDWLKQEAQHEQNAD